MRTADRHEKKKIFARSRFVLAPLGLVSLWLLPGAASAQTGAIDVSKPAPNVMILLDTSGSMEKLPNGKDPTCTLGSVSDKNRWGAAVESLTGTIADASGNEKYSCVTMSRSSGDPVFPVEYAMPGAPASNIYDLNYYLPFHRPASDTCVVAPGYAPGIPVATARGAGGVVTDFNVGGSYPSITTRTYTVGVAPTFPPTTCSFNQFSNGVLDGARDIIRFGLMTFDSDTDPGIGVSGSPLVPTTTPFTGTWSYFSGWDSGGKGQQGKPDGCDPTNLTTHFLEVGARNPAAPPWEGRLIGVPSDPDATVAQMESQNDQIQLAVNAMRPWGATPIAGMFSDAQNYLWNDASGPKADPYVVGGCRAEYIILITDGAPNLDLRPSCVAANGSETNCPYSTTSKTVSDLYAGTGGAKVTTYVVGFAVSDDSGNPVSCSDIVLGTSPTQTIDTSKCGAGSKYTPCCTLEDIALSGSGGKQSAFFAADPSDLSKQLNAVIADITAKTTTRTVPSYSPVVADVPDNVASGVGNAAFFLASLYPTPSQPWSGDVKRQRFVCDATQTLTQPLPTAANGDDFAANLNSHLGATRKFFAVAPDTSPSVDPTTTMRSSVLPYGAIAAADGLPTYTGTPTSLAASTATMGSLTPAALGVASPTNSSPAACANLTQTSHLSANDCKELALRFAFAEQTGPSGLNSTYRPFQSRYDNSFGDVFHATPLVVGPPSALIRDDSYQGFRLAWPSTRRSTVLYAATNDGLLHAFDTGATSQSNNELWAFLPPAVMPQIIGTYPATHALLLDGSPVVKDVVFDRVAAGVGDASKWHSVLVASYGTQGRGYYALDVTDPNNNGDTTKHEPQGPQFLWQLTKMPKELDGSTRELFGSHGGTPAITTVFVDLADASGTVAKHEVGVALVPGGSDAAASGTSCARATADIAKATNLAMPETSYGLRASVRCWPAAGRSLSVVRLDNGEILRTFVLSANDAPTVLANRVTLAPIYAPLTSAPVVYPNTVGSVAERAFIGDADGNILRFDFTSTDPSKWRADIFFDGYNTTVDTATAAWNDGQPVIVQPVVSLDRTGRVVVHFSTGDQETFTNSGTNHVWSITEALSTESPPKLRALPNWWFTFNNGKRVTGPMAVFDGVLYFATYSPLSTTTNKCGGGTPEIYGVDFVTANVNGISFGGIPRFNPAASATIPDSYTPPNSSGLLIPGVSVNVPPTCAKTDTPGTDYVPGAATHYTVTNVNANPPQLVYQFAGIAATAPSQPPPYNLPAAMTGTVIDSWASVVE